MNTHRASIVITVKSNWCFVLKVASRCGPFKLGNGPSGLQTAKKPRGGKLCWLEVDTLYEQEVLYLLDIFGLLHEFDCSELTDNCILLACPCRNCSRPLSSSVYNKLFVLLLQKFTIILCE